MATKKKSLIGMGAAKPKVADDSAGSGAREKAVEPVKSTTAKRLALAKLATAKLSTAKLTTLRRLS